MGGRRRLFGTSYSRCPLIAPEDSHLCDSYTDVTVRYIQTLSNRFSMFRQVQPSLFCYKDFRTVPELRDFSRALRGVIKSPFSGTSPGTP